MALLCFAGLAGLVFRQASRRRKPEPTASAVGRPLELATAIDTDTIIAAPMDGPIAAPIETVGPPHQDDLKVIKGIGPALERALNELGIQTWGQLAALTEDEVGAIDAAAPFRGRIRRDGWVAQADALVQRNP